MTKQAARNEVLEVRNAGMSAEIVGWVAYILVPPAFIIAKGQPKVIAIWSIYLLLGIFLILSGRYIQYRRGRSTGALLVINGLVCLPMLPAVIPIYGVIQSFIGFRGYQRMMKNGSLKTAEMPKRDPSKLAGKITFVIWTVGIALALTYGLT